MARQTHQNHQELLLTFEMVLLSSRSFSAVRMHSFCSQNCCCQENFCHRPLMSKLTNFPERGCLKDESTGSKMEDELEELWLLYIFVLPQAKE